MLTKEQAKQLPIVSERFEQIFHKDHRDCDCEMPMVSKKFDYHLGTFVGVRLCCMAKLVDKIADKLGIESRDVYEVFNFDPTMEWDCEGLHEGLDIDGQKVMRKRGNPPAWKLKRLHDKGHPVHNERN